MKFIILSKKIKKMDIYIVYNGLMKMVVKLIKKWIYQNILKWVIY